MPILFGLFFLMKSNYPYTPSWVCIMQRRKRKIYWICGGEKLLEIFFRNLTYWPHTLTGAGQRIQREEVHILTTFQSCQYTWPYLARLNHLPSNLVPYVLMIYEQGCLNFSAHMVPPPGSCISGEWGPWTIWFINPTKQYLA